MLYDCDYILDKDMNFYIVKGYNNLQKIFANLVFSPDENGDRWNNELKLNYNKVVENNHLPVFLDYKNIIRLYKPREFFSKQYSHLQGIWKKIADSFIQIGIPKEDVGIFGSCLLGFDIKKDIDFVIYGFSNYKILRKNIEKIRKLTRTKKITKEHIKYQIKTHGTKYSKENSFFKLFSNKWSSLQIAPGILTTIRFVYKENEIPDLAKKTFNFTGKEAIIIGEVVEDMHTNFVPRVFKVKSENKVYIASTYFWIFQSCVKRGQIVELKGYLKDNLIILSKFSHYIHIR